MFLELFCLAVVSQVSAAQRESSEFVPVWGGIDPTTLSTTPGSFVLGLPYPSWSLSQEKMRTTDVLIIYLHEASSRAQGFQRIYCFWYRLIFMFSTSFIYSF